MGPVDPIGALDAPNVVGAADTPDVLVAREAVEDRVGPLGAVDRDRRRTLEGEDPRRLGPYAVADGAERASVGVLDIGGIVRRSRVVPK